MEKTYVVGLKAFLLSGKDGYTSFLDKSIERMKPYFGEDDPSIQDVMLKFFKNFRLNND